MRAVFCRLILASPQPDRERAVAAANLCLDDGAGKAAGFQPGAAAFCLDAERPERTRVRARWRGKGL